MKKNHFCVILAMLAFPVFAAEDGKTVKDNDEAILEHPERASNYAKRALAKYKLKQYDEAVKDFDKALSLSPDSSYLYGMRGDARAQAGQYSGAIKDFDKAIELGSPTALLYAKRGYAKEKSGLNKEAVEDYDKAINLNPRYILAYYNRGNIKGRLGLYQEAINDFDKIIAINPKIAPAYACRGGAKLRLKQYREAKTDIEKAVAMKDAYGEYLFGVLYNNGYGVKKDIKSAKFWYQKAVDKNFSPAQNALAYLLAEENSELDKAELLIKKALKQKPDSGCSIDTLGWIMFKQGKYNDAFEQLLKAHKLVPDSATILAHLGDCSLALNKPEQAVEYWREALKTPKKDTDDKDLAAKINSKLEKYEKKKE